MCDTNNKESCFYPSNISSRGCLYWYWFNKSQLKINTVVLPFLILEELVEDEMYVSQGGIPMSTEAMLRISGARGVWSYLTV